ncbi:WhiB family transcriptional regulator [Actinokineospora inagensis]|uniref:WhiB family transcriptional regulator n=1 Tax=Actinokineospora inagensis TaxID=103730 RepID=UPI0004156249|nr:WhiB family transcriptional regulator [Actinokineospora inagensis]
MSKLFERIAADLDRVESAPDEVLSDAVRHRGSCGWLDTADAMPEWTGDDRADRELVKPICGTCPVWRECLESEFRTHGYALGGVWGPLPENERRAVLLLWSERRDGTSGAGGLR